MNENKLLVLQVLLETALYHAEDADDTEERQEWAKEAKALAKRIAKARV